MGCSSIQRWDSVSCQHPTSHLRRRLPQRTIGFGYKEKMKTLAQGFHIRFLNKSISFSAAEMNKEVRGVMYIVHIPFVQNSRSGFCICQLVGQCEIVFFFFENWHVAVHQVYFLSFSFSKTTKILNMIIQFENLQKPSFTFKKIIFFSTLFWAPKMGRKKNFSR